jgi:uncharacterized membrane protein (DUF2068 family)
LNTPYTCPHCQTTQVREPGQQFCVHCRRRFTPAPPPATGRPLPAWTNRNDQLRPPVGMLRDRTPPRGVSLIVIRLALIAIGWIITTGTLNDSFGGENVAFPLMACFALPLIPALGSVVALVGLLEMRAWARYLAIVITLVDSLSGMVYAPFGPVTIPAEAAPILWAALLGGALGDLAVVVYLLRPSIRERFE